MPISTSSHELNLRDSDGDRDYTRDQLLVSGYLEGDLIHLIVNHWPSRSGGEARSRSKREAAAALNKRLIDSLQSNDPYAKVFSMGDLNDNPNNSSLKKILNAKGNRKKVGFKGIYNPMEPFFKSGLGSNAYRDAWSLFDQILITKPLLEDDYSSFKIKLFDTRFKQLGRNEMPKLVQNEKGANHNLLLATCSYCLVSYATLPFVSKLLHNK